MPGVLHSLPQVNLLGKATEGRLGDRGFGATLRIQHTQTLVTGELELID